MYIEYYRTKIIQKYTKVKPTKRKQLDS